jgi:hypothetical protein
MPKVKSKLFTKKINDLCALLTLTTGLLNGRMKEIINLLSNGAHEYFRILVSAIFFIIDGWNQ